MKVCTYYSVEEVIKMAIKEVGKDNIKPETLKRMKKCLKKCKTVYGFAENLNYALSDMFDNGIVCYLAEIVGIFNEMPEAIKNLIDD